MGSTAAELMPLDSSYPWNNGHSNSAAAGAAADAATAAARDAADAAAVNLSTQVSSAFMRGEPNDANADPSPRVRSRFLRRAAQNHMASQMENRRYGRKFGKT